MTTEAASLLPAHLFEDTARSALRSTQSRFALKGQGFLRYQPEVAPFAVVTADGGLEALAAAMAADEISYLLAADATPPGTAAGLRVSPPSAVTQMVFPHQNEIGGDDSTEVVDLGCEGAAEMVDLTAIEYPGFFRPRTCEMGPYFGIRRNGLLVAMGGDRMVLDPFHEVSGIVVRADYRGQGLAQTIVRHILRRHRAAGKVSFLHASSSNVHAIGVYQRLGFVTTREIWVTKLRKLATV